MNFTTSIIVCFQKYASAKGRAVRSEFWYFYLFELIASIAGSIVDTNIGTAVAVVTFLPMLTCSIRRLHDINRSGWWVLIGLTIIGIPILIYWYCKKGDEHENRYGPATESSHLQEG